MPSVRHEPQFISENSQFTLRIVIVLLVKLVAATNTSNYSASPTVLLLNGDVPACLAIGIVTPSIASSFLVGTGTFCLSPLTPTLTAFPFFLLRITDTKLRTTIRTDTKLKLGLCC